VDICCLAADRCGNEADAVYDVVVLDLEYVLAVLGCDNNGLILDLTDGVLKVSGYFVECKCITQEGSVCEADVLCRNEVLCELYDDGVLASKDQIVCCFASRLTAAEEYDLVANGLLVAEQICEGHALLEAGDSHLSGDSAGCNDDFIKLTSDNAEVVDLGVEAPLDVVLLNFVLVPCDELLVVFFEGHCGSGEEQAADLVGLLEDGGLVAALCKNDSCFAAADAGADDSDLLGCLGGNDLISVVLHGGRSKCATAKVEGVFQTLDVCGASVLSKVEAAIVAADAGLDLVFLAVEDLEDPVGVTEVLTCNCNSVKTAGSDLFRSDLGGHTACACNGLVGELLDVLNVSQVAVVGHILRRMCPVPGVIGTVIGVEEVIAHVAEVLDGLLGLFHVTAELGDLACCFGNDALAEVCAVGNCGVTEGYGEVIAAVLLDALNDLYGEAISVLEGAAVLVGTLVPVLHGELVEEIALVDSVDLNAVNACVLKSLCGLAEALDHVLNFLYGERTGHEGRIPAVRSLGSGCCCVAYIDDGGCELVEDGVLVQVDHPGSDSHGTAEACSELYEQLCAGLMELFHVGLQFLEHLLVLVQPVSAGHTHGVADTLHTGENEADALLGSLKQEISCFLVEMAGLEPAKQGGTAHGALDNAVLDLYIADLKGGK